MNRLRCALLVAVLAAAPLASAYAASSFPRAATLPPIPIDKGAVDVHANAESEFILREMAERPQGALVRELAKQPGARETRWAHLHSGEPAFAAEAPVAASGANAHVDAGELAAMKARIDALEATVARLCRELGITPGSVP